MDKYTAPKGNNGEQWSAQSKELVERETELKEEESIQIAKVALDFNFQEKASDPNPYLEETEQKKVSLVKGVVETLRVDPKRILSMPISPVSETDSDMEKAERQRNPQVVNEEEWNKWVESMGLTQDQLQQKVSWGTINEAYKIGGVINDLVCHYNYDEDYNPVGEISLRKFLELIRVAVCGEVYVHNVVQDVRSKMRESTPDNAPNGEFLSIFNPSLPGRAAYFGDLGNRHLIAFRTDIDVYANPYFDFRKVQERDASSASHELAHARHAELIGGGEVLYIHGKKLELPSNENVDVDARENLWALMNQVGIDEEIGAKYKTWFAFVEGYATYAQLQYINAQIDSSNSEEDRTRWATVRDNFLKRLRYLQEDGVTKEDEDTRCMLEPYNKGVMLIHKIDKAKASGESLSVKISSYKPDDFVGVSVDDFSKQIVSRLGIK